MVCQLAWCFAPRHLSRCASPYMLSDKNKNLEELDGENWGEPNYNSYVVTNCHRLRRVSLKDFTVEDLRLMIGQGISLKFLIPLALEYLESNSFAEGDFYPGDLLNNVLDVSREFWNENPSLLRRISVITEKATTELDKVDLSDEIKKEIEEKLNAFG